MRSPYEQAVGQAAEIDRHLRRGTDKIVGRKFGRVAKVLWPDSTAATLAAIAGKKTAVRTAERWLAGEHEPPGIVLAAAIVEMIRVQ
jgi:hypothetical protein